MSPQDPGHPFGAPYPSVRRVPASAETKIEGDWHGRVFVV
jgi:hypothetical protein